MEAKQQEKEDRILYRCLLCWARCLNRGLHLRIFHPVLLQKEPDINKHAFTPIGIYGEIPEWQEKRKDK